MADASQSYSDKQEFWKPALAPRPELETASAPQSCSRCHEVLMQDARYCHACGAQARTGSELPAWFDLASLRDFLGQSTLSLIALALGAFCLAAAVVTGFLFSANTLLDWQAVQIWRIEWLLAAIALFVAGILLRQPRQGQTPKLDIKETE